MIGLLALLDDILAITKVAASQLDDVAGQAAQVSASALDDVATASSKAAGVVIDDAAVTPKYVTGLPAARELPVVWKIARGSLFNKLIILLPAALLLDAFLPWLITPLLMLGGGYLCFEGAEKIVHVLSPHPHEHKDHAAKPLDAAKLEETRVRGAIQTDFILSAEIMAISLASISAGDLLSKAIALAIVAVVITAGVYGAVAVLVKADDVGLQLAQSETSDAIRGLGRGIVRGMPMVTRAIAYIGTAAMLWVGGSILVHGLHDLGSHELYEGIKHAAKAVDAGGGFGAWFVTAALDGIFGLAVGLVLIGILRVVSRLRG